MRPIASNTSQLMTLRFVRFNSDLSLSSEGLFRKNMDTKAAQKQLVGLITQHLSESIPVTRILTYKPDKNGSVTGRFESLNRVFNFVFSGNDVRYKPAMNADSALFSEYFLQRFDAAPETPRGTRALPKCTSQSYSCKGNVGVRCLPLTQNCKLGNSAIGDERLDKITGLSKLLASSGEDNSKVEAAKAKLVEQRMALAVEKKVEQQATKDLKPEPAKQVSLKHFKQGLDEWDKYTKTLSREEKKNIPSLADNQDVTSWIKDIYISSKEVNAPSVKNSDHIAVIDSKGLTQAAMAYTHSKEKGFKIEFLATAPWNLQKEHPNKQKGSGAKAIVEAIKKSKELGYGGKISLEALGGAIPFYEHLGFDVDLNSCTISPKNAEKLLKKYGA